MNAAFITIFLSFIEGFSLILSPCILPILPIFLAGSLSGSQKRPLGIVLGFTVFFAILAIFSRQLVHLSGIDLNTVRYISFILLLFLGIIMMSSWLTEKFSQLTQGIGNIGASFFSKNNHQAGFLNGLFLGALIAIVWTPCAGPILATVIVQTVLQKTNVLSFFVVLAFALGAAIPMLIIALYGKMVLNRLNLFKTHSGLLRNILGAIVILSVVMMVYIEKASVTSTIVQTEIKTTNTLIDGVWHQYPAPQIAGIDAWINSKPLNETALKNKVILVDFWTYSCINCQRTLPYLKDWYRKYHDKGLLIIGIHSPEFDFEKNLANVESAVQRNGILYPVALDNHFVTWTNFANHFWPAHYLIDKKGQVVYKHFGEGDYAITENNIRYLLGIKDLQADMGTPEELQSLSQSPETYLGYGRADTQLSPATIHDKTSKYSSSQLPLNSWGLDGFWHISFDSIISAQDNAAIKIHFNARKVFAVMGNTSGKPISVNLLFNGKPLTINKGKNVINSTVIVDGFRLYELMAADKSIQGVLQLRPTKPGVKLYTFTFGS